jgi:hypothetical protein
MDLRLDDAALRQMKSLFHHHFNPFVIAPASPMWDILLPVECKGAVRIFQLEFRAQVAELGLTTAENAGLANDSYNRQWTKKKKKRKYPSIYIFLSLYHLPLRAVQCSLPGNAQNSLLSRCADVSDPWTWFFPHPLKPLTSSHRCDNRADSLDG